ncbi:hypothetical protein CDL15_Pgr023450 [Punica granatum]|uniref:Uncharacterized protein n=1 Tax=Punica granatum TaxID=22663 RepID=A0A218WV06_PUNGR|nr:hypothetical protein CDL15_Pgr008712 [Punica granatum]OWM76605.1 hypothetical protein CDL15_Pgr023450 [Punica granatum]
MVFLRSTQFQVVTTKFDIKKFVDTTRFNFWLLEKTTRVLTIIPIVLVDVWIVRGGARIALEVSETSRQGGDLLRIVS